MRYPAPRRFTLLPCALATVTGAGCRHAELTRSGFLTDYDGLSLDVDQRARRFPSRRTDPRARRDFACTPATERLPVGPGSVGVVPALEECMRYDLSQIEDKDSFASVPEGIYECKVTEVRVTMSRDGSERWSLRLVVADGEYAGRTAAWDSVTWSERGVVRVKRVLEALGFDVGGEVELEAGDLKGLRARVQVMLEQYEDSVSGRRMEHMTVPFHGWGPVESVVTNIDGAANTGEALVHGASTLGDGPF